MTVSKSCEHKDYPVGFENCTRTEAKMIGYLFSPEPSINGTKMDYIYINDLKGMLPGMVVQMMANNMMKKGFIDMGGAMKKFMAGDLVVPDDVKNVELND